MSPQLRDRLLAALAPLAVAGGLLIAWEWAVFHYRVPAIVLPPPSAILLSLVSDGERLLAASLVTLRITASAFLAALVAGVLLAVLFAQSRAIAAAFLPYAVILQVTPVVAIAPLILIWSGLDDPQRAVLILAFIVALFPILSNTTLGLRSTDRNLIGLFELYGASRLQKLIHLQLPAALPHILAGAKISGGLALIGAVVAEFAAGSGASAGLAWVIIEAGNKLKIARMFAALTILSAIGIAIFALLSGLEYALLRRWHDSARPHGE